jgi:drug/metabolite transporter (DMT)-like permease
MSKEKYGFNLQNPYILLHIAVFLWGFTAIIGKVITLSSLNLVWHRMWIASLGYVFFNNVIPKLRKHTFKEIIQVSGIGVIVMIHWLTFYGSIKIYNSSSLTLACLGTAALFSSIIEPIVTDKKFRWRELMIGLLSLIGILIIFYANPTPNDKVQTENYFLAIIVGLSSAFLAALFTALNKKIGDKYESEVMSFIELGSGWLALSLCLPFFIDASFQFIPSKDDIFWLVVLGLLCTNLTFNIGLKALKKLSAFTANLSVNLEPIYGFILAAFIFKEHETLNGYFYLGAGIVLASVIVHPLLDRMKDSSTKSID